MLLKYSRTNRLTYFPKLRYSYKYKVMICNLKKQVFNRIKYYYYTLTYTYKRTNTLYSIKSNNNNNNK